MVETIDTDSSRAITYTAQELLAYRHICTTRSVRYRLAVDITLVRAREILAVERACAEAWLWENEQAAEQYPESMVDALYQRTIDQHRGSEWRPLSLAATHAHQQLTLRRNLREFSLARAAYWHRTRTLSQAERWALLRARNIRRQQQWQRRQRRRA